MKSLNLFLATALTLFAFATNVEARVNPAVQPIFFEHLQNVLPSSEPAAVGHDGTVTEVTLEGLAWAVNNVKNDHVPLVIEFYSSNQSACVVNAQSGDNECVSQARVTAAAAAPYQDRVRFLRIDVSNYSVLLNGPDVRVLPSHIFVADYSDSTHYSAIKVGGYLDQQALQSAVKDTLAVDP
jgi:hypothetical protein